MDPAKRASIIVPCRNEGIKIKQTLDFFLRTEAADSTEAEIIVVDDGSQDGCCDFLRPKPAAYSGIKLLSTPGLGAARARNTGALHSRGEILVFCDAHILVPKGWLNTLLSSLEETGAGAVSPGIGPMDPSRPAGYGQTWNEKMEVRWLKKPGQPVPIPLAPGACLAVKREVFEKTGGFDNGFSSWGSEDLEFSLKLWLFGFSVYVEPRIRIGHHFRRKPPYTVNGTEFTYNKLRMALSHFSKERFAAFAGLLKNDPHIPAAFAKLIFSDSLDQRKRYFKERVRSDDWFFAHFHIPF